MRDEPARSQVDADNPWPGLEAYEEDAQEFFHGRDAEAADLLLSVLDSPVTVLYGRSGLGKTSLLRASLFPALRDRHFFPVYVRLDLRRDAQPIAEQLRDCVRYAVEARVPDARRPANDESLWEYLHRVDLQLWDERYYRMTPVIVLDQFEEVFTLGGTVPDRVREFVGELGDLLENRIPAALAARMERPGATLAGLDLRSHDYRFLISLREDFLPDLEGWRPLIPALGRSRQRLLPMSTESALAAVHEPARQIMTRPQAELIVRFVAGENGHGDSGGRRDPTRGGAHAHVEPALLSLFCRELNEARKRSKRPQIDEQLIDGAQRDVLRNYYLSCVKDLPDVARFVEDELLTSRGFRNSFARDDAVPLRLTEEQLSRLVDARLLRIEDRYGTQRIELTHDVLTGVVRERRDQRRVEEEKDALAQKLARARKAAEDSDRRQRRTRNVAVVMGLLLVVAFVLGYAAYANAARAEAALRLAWSRQVGGMADQLVGTRPDVAILAGLQSLSLGRDNDIPPTAGLVTGLARTTHASRLLSGHINAVRSVAFSPGGGLVATGSDDQTVRLWDAATGQPVGAPLAGHDGVVWGVAFSLDGRLLASGSEDQSVRLWDATTGAPVGAPLAGHTGAVWGVAFRPDGRLASAGADGTVRLWDAATGSAVRSPLTGHAGAVLGVAFGPGGRLASAGADGTVRLWDPATGSAVDSPLTGHTGAVRAVAFGPDGTIASGGDDGTVRLWDPAGLPRGSPLTGHTDAVAGVAFSPDGRMLASASDDGTVRLWDATTGEPAGPPLTGHADAVHDVAFSPDSEWITTGSSDRTARIWAATATPSISRPLTGHSASVNDVAFSPDGRWMASASTDQTVRLWDATTGRPYHAPLTGHTSQVNHLAFSPDSRLLASTSDDQTVRLWDVVAAEPHGAPLTGHIGWVRKVAFSPDGTLLATVGGDGTVRLWDVATGAQDGAPLTGHAGWVWGVAFSPDGDLIASAGGDGTVRLWDVVTSEPVGAPLTGHTGAVWAVAFSPDGELLASVGDDGTARLWDPGTGRLLHTLIGHSGVVRGVAFSPDGQLLATAGGDQAVRLWNVATGRPHGAPLTGHTGPVWEVAFDSGSGLLASASADRTVRIWDPDFASWVATGCALVNRNLSLAEWDQVAQGLPYERTCPGLPAGDGAPADAPAATYG